jgi:RecA-family ATPase
MLDTITAPELMRLDLPPPKQIVTGLLTSGLNILAGTAKAGKSFLGMSLGLSVANGTLALGRFDTQQAGVLYLALEDTRFRLKSRLGTLKQPIPESLAFATTAPTLAAGTLEGIDAYLKAHRETGMVVIDTLAKVADQHQGGNVYAEDSQMGGALHALAHAHDIALLVIHHTRKQAHKDFLQMVSGSTGFTGAADTVLVFERNRNDPMGMLHVTGRDIVERQVELEWRPTGGGWHVYTPQARPRGRPADTAARSRIQAPRPYAEGD